MSLFYEMASKLENNGYYFDGDYLIACAFFGN